MVFTQDRGFVLGASFGLQVLSLRCRFLVCNAADTASLATRFLFGKLIGVAALSDFGEKRCRKNLPLCGTDRGPLETAISHSDILVLVIPPFREPSSIGRTFRRWFPNWWRPSTDVIVFEHSDGDWDRAHCTGDPIRAWRVTPDGPVEIPTDTEIDRSSVGPWFRSSSVFRFCVSNDFTRIIYSRLHGPRAGSGATYTIRSENGNITLGNPTSQWRA